MDISARELLFVFLFRRHGRIVAAGKGACDGHTEYRLRISECLQPVVHAGTCRAGTALVGGEHLIHLRQIHVGIVNKFVGAHNDMQGNGSKGSLLQMQQIG